MFSPFIYAAMVAHILVVSLSFSKILSFFLSHIYEYTYSHLLIVERKTLWIITCLISSLHPCFHKKLLKTNFSYQHYFQINHFEHLNGRISSSILIFYKNGLWNILILPAYFNEIYYDLFLSISIECVKINYQFRNNLKAIRI